MTWPCSRPTGSRASARLSAFRKGAPAAVVSLVLLVCGRAEAAATGQINKLSDVAFTALNPLVAATNSQSLCVYSSGTGKGYSITATGSGAGGAFQLSAGSGLLLSYGVQWSSSSGAASGTSMSAGVALTGQTSTATIAGCTLGAATTASLIVAIAPADLQSATTGVSYSGMLTLLLAPQ